MRGRWSRTGCMAPVHARGGWLRCVVQAKRCDYPGHQRWNRWGWPLVQVVWWLKPWWPNAIGRAQDRAGRARYRSER